MPRPQTDTGRRGGGGVPTLRDDRVAMDSDRYYPKQSEIEDLTMPKLSQKNAPYAHSLTAGQARRVAWVRENAPAKLSPFLRAYGGKSPAAGIKAQCLDCTGCDVEAVRQCTADACPLWAYRPYRPGKLP